MWSASDAVFGVSCGPKHPKQPRPNRGHSAPQPARVTGPRHGIPDDTATHTTPRRLHSTQTLYECSLGIAALHQRLHHLEQLALVDRAPRQLDVDRDVGRDGRAPVESGDVRGVRVHLGEELLDVGEVAQGLDAPAGRARADRHEDPRLPTDLLDALGVTRGGDRALDERHVVRTWPAGSCRLREVRDVEDAGELEQLVLAVEQRELAPVAGGELPHREAGARDDVGDHVRAPAG